MELLTLLAPLVIGGLTITSIHYYRMQKVAFAALQDTRQTLELAVKTLSLTEVELEAIHRQIDLLKKTASSKQQLLDFHALTEPAELDIEPAELN